MAQEYGVAWARRFAESPFAVKKRMRIETYQSTLRILDQLGYQKGASPAVSLGTAEYNRRQAEATRLYDGMPETIHAVLDAGATTEIVVHEADCLDVSAALQRAGLRPVCLNMASDFKPGGGVRGGAGAQEENLFRRTSLAQHFFGRFVPVRPHWRYPLRGLQCVYTPRAWVFRASEANGYELLDEPYELSFIAMPAPRRPHLVAGGTRMNDDAAAMTRARIGTILGVALDNGHDAIVLSALGCGAFCCPPSHIAELFHSVLHSEPFVNRFKRVAFAIFDDHNARKAHNPTGNVAPFVEMFKE